MGDLTYSILRVLNRLLGRYATRSRCDIVESYDGFDLFRANPPQVEYDEPLSPYRRFVCVESIGFGQFKCWSRHCPVHSERVKRKHVGKAKAARPKAGIYRWAITLPVGDYVPQRLLAKGRASFNRTMRRSVDPFEYFWVLHHHGPRYNYHLLAKTRADNIGDPVRESWRSAMGRVARRTDLGGTFYVQPCYTWEGYADYMVDLYGDDPVAKQPPRHLFHGLCGFTKGFFTL